MLYENRSTTRRLFVRSRVKNFFSKLFVYLGSKCCNLLPEQTNSLKIFAKEVNILPIGVDGLGYLKSIIS